MARPTSRVAGVEVPGPLVPFVPAYRARLRGVGLYAVDDGQSAAPGGASEPLDAGRRVCGGRSDRRTARAVLRCAPRRRTRRVLTSEPVAAARACCEYQGHRPLGRSVRLTRRRQPHRTRATKRCWPRSGATCSQSEGSLAARRRVCQSRPALPVVVRHRRGDGRVDDEGRHQGGRAGGGQGVGRLGAGLRGWVAFVPAVLFRRGARGGRPVRGSSGRDRPPPLLAAQGHQPWPTPPRCWGHAIAAERMGGGITRS